MYFLDMELHIKFIVLLTLYIFVYNNRKADTTFGEIGNIKLRFFRNQNLFSFEKSFMRTRALNKPYKKHWNMRNKNNE